MGKPLREEIVTQKSLVAKAHYPKIMFNEFINCKNVNTQNYDMSHLP